MQVTIDGVPYAPVCNTVARIGIAITTHNRADVLKRALAQHQNAGWKQRKRSVMYSRLLTICLAMMLIVSCAKTGPARVEVVDTACDWVKPLYLTDHDIGVLDNQTKRDILAHNRSWQVN